MRFVPFAFGGIFAIVAIGMGLAYGEWIAAVPFALIALVVVYVTRRGWM